MVIRREALAALCSVLAGTLYFVGFAGFGVWPLSFVALVPLLVALRGRSGWRAWRLGWLTGIVTNAGGFYWIVPLLRTFSGFPTGVCTALATLLFAAQGFQFAVFAGLVTRADRNGLSRLLSVPAALAALELTFPLLFPSYTANALHRVLPLIQIADLGGPIVISAALAWGYAMIERTLVDRRRHWRSLAWVVAFWEAAGIYGGIRIAQVDRESGTARALRVAVVQENLGLLEKRNEPEMALDRHLAVTRALEAQHPDLVVWSESAVAFLVDPAAPNIRDSLPPWDLHVPVLFGALTLRDGAVYNTAVMVDAEGRFVGTYDKTYLLAFGEYLPGGEWFPKLYQWSPNSGHFARGNRHVALSIPTAAAGGDTVLPLICYEDVLPRFVRAMQGDTRASLMAVILNDAWFGDSTEPWIHLALSQFRSIEHRRDFVRAANSGVSAFIDAAGRVLSHTGTFTRAAPMATVHLRHGRTVYDLVGDWAGYAGLVLIAWGARPRRRRAATGPARTSTDST